MEADKASRTVSGQCWPSSAGKGKCAHHILPKAFYVRKVPVPLLIHQGMHGRRLVEQQGYRFAQACLDPIRPGKVDHRQQVIVRIKQLVCMMPGLRPCSSIHMPVVNVSSSSSTGAAICRGLPSLCWHSPQYESGVATSSEVRILRMLCEQLPSSFRIGIPPSVYSSGLSGIQ